MRYASPCVLAILLAIGHSSSMFHPARAEDAPTTKPVVRDKAGLTYPPALPGERTVVTDSDEAFLKPPDTLKAGVVIAKVPPTVDFLFYPGQDYPGKPWSAWGDSLAANGKYYASIGDHLAPGGNAFVFEYDPAKKVLRRLVDVRALLRLPEGHYTPGKIHGRLDLGSDGWLYFSTHRGSARATTDQYHYKGDWIIRCHPDSGKNDVLVHGPIAKHCIPNSVLDPERLIFYGGTAAGSSSDDEGVRFFAYDLKNRRLLYEGPDGPARYMIFAKSTGRVYYVAGKGDGPLMRFDPDKPGPPVLVQGTRIGIRAATHETVEGMVYTVSLGQRSADTELWSFNTKTEEIRNLGMASVGSQAYIASLDVDPSGRYLYYIPGAHGGSDRDGSPLVQFDVNSGQKKVLAFLHPFYRNKYGFTLKGTYSVAVDPKGDKIYVTWNVSRGSRAWDCVALTCVHISPTERK